MDFRDSADLSRSRTGRASGSGGGGGRVALGGGVGGLVLLVLTLVIGPSLGLDLTSLLGSGAQQNQGSGQASDLSHCQQGSDIAKDRTCRWVAYEVAAQDYWSQAISGYKYGEMQLFSGTIATACGTGQTQMGPFYCSGDSTVYIDDQYVGQLLTQLGASGGDAAELYIVAHEFGHHVQNLEGTLRSVSRDTGENSGQVRLELQADCYAGVFFNNTLKDPNSPIESVTKDDLLRIADAARSVGDDHIQSQQGGFVNPESWTHGSSEQRQRWVSIGFDTGNPAACNTFNTNDL
ncbi:MAG: neutral zinc metallopeptidase [Propionibacteriaceae bacterium]|nr:neutral zinc metallopeptidase [Propionibacteriaceae bacterium]